MTARKLERLIIIIAAAVAAIAMLVVPLAMYGSYVAGLPESAKLTSLVLEGTEELPAYGISGSFAPEVTAVYDSGKTNALSAENYSLSFEPALIDGDKAAYNRSYTVTAAHSGGAKGVAVLDVSGYYQGEDALIVGGEAKTENGMTFAGGFTPDTEESSVEFTVYSDGGTVADIDLRVAHGNIQTSGGSPTDAEYSYLAELALGDVVDLTVNGANVDLSGIMLPGAAAVGKDNWASLYGIYSTVDVNGIPLSSGENKIKLTFTPTTYKNAWGESPNLNVDYIRLVPLSGSAYSAGSEKTAEYMGKSEINVTDSVTFDSLLEREEYFARVRYNDGKYRYASLSDFTVTVDPEEPTGLVGVCGEYKMTATLKTSRSVSFDITVRLKSKTFSVDEGTIVGGTVGSDGDLTYAGNFNTNKNLANYIEFTFLYAGSGISDVTLSIANGFLRTNDDGLYYMKELTLSSVLDVIVNGENYDYGSDIKLSESEASESYGELYRNFEEVTIAGVPLKSGVNTIRLSLKLSTLGEATCWRNEGAFGGDFESPVVDIAALRIADAESAYGEE